MYNVGGITIIQTLKIDLIVSLFKEQKRIRWNIIDILSPNTVKMISLYRKTLSEEDGVTV